MCNTDYIKFIHKLKQEILSSRLKALQLINNELTVPYFNPGKRISIKTKKYLSPALDLINIVQETEEYYGLTYLN